MAQKFTQEDQNRLNQAQSTIEECKEALKNKMPAFVAEVSSLGINNVTKSAEALEAVNDEVLQPVLSEMIETMEATKVANRKILAAGGNI